MNESTEGEVSSDGSEFHQVGPMEQNARSPYVTDRVIGTFSLQNPLDQILEVGVRLSLLSLQVVSPCIVSRDRKPVELTKDWGDMVVLASTSQETSSSVLTD